MCKKPVRKAISTFRVSLTARRPSRWWAPCAVVSLGEGSVCVAILFVITTG